MSFLSPSELEEMGFAALGPNVLLSRRASVHGAARISIGANTRIDDFCVISAGEGGIEIGHHVHIATMVSLIGKARIVISDFAGLSARVSLFSSNDDYSGGALTGPTVPDELRNVTNLPVTIGRHAVVGAGSVILPGADLGDGCTIGALSLIRGKLEGNMIYVGVPAKPLRPRKTDYLALEALLMADASVGSHHKTS